MIGPWQEGLFTACSRMMVKLTALPQPVIARVHGIATAAGCQLVSMCDLAVASEGARFALPGVNIGVFFCSTPAVGVARNIGRKRSLEMLLTGELFDAHRPRMRPRQPPIAGAYALTGDAMACGMLEEDAAEGIDAFLGKRPARWPRG
jgi:1,4-dihydroxy-2-naphthoyl-CoA synthase